MTKLQKARNTINERFRQIMPRKFYAKFGIELETRWNFFANAVCSVRADGESFTDEQRNFIAAFEDGYAQSLTVLDELIYPVQEEV